MAILNTINTPSVTVGGQKKSSVEDTNLNDLMREILIQIKIMNSHLSMITGEELDEGEI